MVAVRPPPPAGVSAPPPPAIQGPRGEHWEKVGNWTQGKKRGRVSGVLSVPLPLLAQEDP
eukprot:1188848-Prorocentrum_minimum.AAC.2